MCEHKQKYTTRLYSVKKIVLQKENPQEYMYMHQSFMLSNIVTKCNQQVDPVVYRSVVPGTVIKYDLILFCYHLLLAFFFWTDDIQQKIVSNQINNLGKSMASV